MKSIQKRLIPTLLVVTSAVCCMTATPSFAFTVGTEDVQIVVSEAAADSSGERPVIKVEEVEPYVDIETVEVMPSVPCVHPEIIVTDVQSVSIPSAHDVQSIITSTRRLPEFVMQAKEMQAQASELNRQLLAYDNRPTAQTPGHSPADREAWEVYRKAYNLILSEQWKQAVSAFDSFEKRFRKSDWADDAAYWNVYAREKSGEEPDQVYKRYEQFVEQYRGSRWVETARGNMVGVANRLAMSGKPEFADKIRMVGFDGNLSVTLSALTALQMMGEDAIPEMETLYMKTSNPVTKERILSTVLANRSPKSTNFLIRIAETDSSDALRKKAVDFLGSGTTYKQAANVYSDGFTMTVAPRPKTAAPEDKKAVLDALGRIARDDPSEVVRGQALYWLGNSGTDEGWVKLLETAAKTDPSMEVRQKALLALSQMPDGKGVPGLIAVAKSDGSVSIRSIAITYLGMSKDPRAKEALREIVRQGD